MNANQSASELSNSAAIELAPPTRRMVRRFLFAALLLLPIPFGSVHEQVNLPFSIILNLLTLFLVLRSPRAVSSLFSGRSGRLSQLVTCCLSATIVYSIAQYYAFGFSISPHPVLGSIDQRVDGATFFTGIREFINFLCAFIITRLYLSNSIRAANALTRVSILSGGILSFIALSHWFYDNGNLFWVFEPETVAVINRARWPFVNPNHLGDYMAACGFITLGSVLGLFRRLFDHELERGRRRNRSLVALIGSEDFHVKVIKPLLMSVPLLTMTLALLASQSRGGWLGASIGLVLYALLSTFAGRSAPTPENPHVVSLEQHRSRRHRRGRSKGALRMDGSWAMILVQTIEKYMRPLCIGGAVLIVLFFLNSKGRDIVSGRLEFGLMHSMEDIRWTFYRNSWEMFLENPIFGVGLGGWASNYARFTSPALAGLNPVYLHSDPYQLLLELGILGALPIATLSISTIVLGIGATRRLALSNQQIPVIALLAGITAFAVSTLPEFPLRIPAISFSFAVWLGLLAARTEHADNLAQLNVAPLD